MDSMSDKLDNVARTLLDRHADHHEINDAVEWLRELEQRAEAAAAVVRVAALEIQPGDVVVVTIREKLDVSMTQWVDIIQSIKAQLRQATGMPDLKVTVVDGADVSVLRKPDPHADSVGEVWE
jgi:hypothetical protein